MKSSCEALFACGKKKGGRENTKERNGGITGEQP
jgi:hypothetical protein